MKQTLVQTLEQGGNTFGQVNNPRDIMNAQEFVHQRIHKIVNEFLNNSNIPEVKGFGYSLGAGNLFNISITAPGTVYAASGVSYDLASSATLTFDPAHPTLPRYDLVIAKLEDEVAAELNLIPFVRLRTPAEFEAEAPAYPPSNISAPTEQHWRTVVQIKKGTASANPQRPALDSNEVVLYSVAIAAGMTRIEDANVTDLRGIARSLRELHLGNSDNRVDLSEIYRRIAALEDLGGQPIDLSQILGEIQSLEEILALLLARTTSAADLPEIRYDRPKWNLTDKRSSQIIATASTVLGVKVIDIEVGGVVNFGDAEVAIKPDQFEDQSVNPRFVTVGSGGPAHVKRDVVITLPTVTVGASDGEAKFVGKASHLTPARHYPGTAARNAQFVEIFGGVATDNSSALSDWQTYDTINDTITTRTLTGVALPASDRPALFPMGDGNNVLVLAGSTGTNTPRCFKVNATTGVVTEIATTKPIGTCFYGDLIAAGKVFLMGINYTTGALTHWEYDVALNTFTALSVTGSVPQPIRDSCGGCFFLENQFIFLHSPNNQTGQGKTSVFDRTTLQWTQLTINFPYANFGDILPINHFRMANVNNRPLLIGGFINVNGSTAEGTSYAWEFSSFISSRAPFKTQSWNQLTVGVPARYLHAFCSTIGGDSRPSGRAFMFGGLGKFITSQTQIFGSTQSGLIATTYNGADGISIGDGSTFAQFELPSFTAAWDVAAYFAGIKGRFTGQNIKLEVSLDDGLNWTTVLPDRTTPFTNSAVPGVRRLRITLYRSGANPPIITGLTETYDQDGATLSETRLVIRYNAPNVVKALYIDRTGKVTLSTVIEPSNPLKAIIHKVTPGGGNPDQVKNYVNRRRPHLKYEGLSQAGLGASVPNELAVPIRYIDARAKKSTGVVGTNTLYHVTMSTGPNNGFDGTFDVDPVVHVLPDDMYIIEIEG